MNGNMNTKIESVYPTHHHNDFVPTCRLSTACGILDALLVLEQTECSTKYVLCSSLCVC